MLNDHTDIPDGAYIHHYIKAEDIQQAPVIDSMVPVNPKIKPKVKVKNICTKCKLGTIRTQRVNVSKCTRVDGNYTTVVYCTHCDYEEFE